MRQSGPAEGCRRWRSREGRAAPRGSGACHPLPVGPILGDPELSAGGSFGPAQQAPASAGVGAPVGTKPSPRNLASARHAPALFPAGRRPEEGSGLTSLLDVHLRVHVLVAPGGAPAATLAAIQQLAARHLLVGGGGSRSQRRQHTALCCMDVGRMKRKRCEHPLCYRVPEFNVQGATEPILCEDHKCDVTLPANTSASMLSSQAPKSRPLVHSCFILICKRTQCSGASIC